MTPKPGRAVASTRKGRRWVDLDGEGSLGRTTDEAAKARQRAARTKAAAAARRAQARTGAPYGGSRELGEPPTREGHVGSIPEPGA
jgi:sRNA-binding protein